MPEWGFVALARNENSTHGTKTGATITNDCSKRTKLVSARDSNFPQQARANGLLEQDDRTPPTNLNRILARLEQDRSSPVPDEAYFDRYKGKVRVANSESRITTHVLDLLVRDEEVSYEIGQHASFSEFLPDQGFNDNLSIPAPDFYQGFLKSSFGCNRLLEAIGEFVTPAGGSDPITLAHFVGELKKPGEGILRASQQVSHAAACLVEGRRQIGLHMSDVHESNVAYVAGFVTDGRHLRLSVHFNN